MSEAETIIAKLHEIRTTINEAQINLGEGKVTDLSRLNAEASQICDQVLQLPPAEAKKAQAPMADIIGALETFATALDGFKTEMKEKVK